LYKLFGHFSLVLLVGFTTLDAQSFENFKKSQTQSFQTYKDERDSAFNKYLKQEWKAYNAYAGTPLYEEPKPANITPTQPQISEPVGPKISIKIKKALPIESKPAEDTVVIKKETPVTIELKMKDKEVNIDFYGSRLGFDVPSGIKKANFYPQTQEGIANFFSSAASSEYESLISDINLASTAMELNDWGVYLLVSKISAQVYTNQENAKLLSCFIFNKLGYAVKIGLANKHVVLMHYSEKIIYSTPNYSFDEKKYYVVANYDKGSIGRVFSYKQDYPGSIKPLDLSLNTLPKLSSDIKSKTLAFTQFGNTYSVPFEYNKNLLDFMATYPQADYETFFNAPVDSRTYEAVASALKKYIDGKKASEAMNFVLSFVQKSFAYERDDQQFGREKVMFAQETLYFDKSDCEDRAVLFSYLVKELFSVSVVGVKYKDHMATALYVPINGDEVTSESKRFVVADPTYVNANIGMSMPKYKSIKPQSFIIVSQN
jgi:hypothetical protein